MAFSITTADLPILSSYNDAKEAYERIKPIRGSNSARRPLGTRTAKHKWITHEVHDGHDVYTVGLNETPLIKYYPTHYNISLGGWVTRSTLDYISAIASGYIYIF